MSKLTNTQLQKIKQLVDDYSKTNAKQTAKELEEIWISFPSKKHLLLKEKEKQKLKTVGISNEVLKNIGKTFGKGISKNRIDDFLPLTKILWDEFGLEGRKISVFILGEMELRLPDKLIPFIKEIASTCISWEDCDDLALDALEPVVRKEPDRYLDEITPMIKDENKWVKRAGITVIGRLPMKHPKYTKKCLSVIEPALEDNDIDIKRVNSFAIRMGVRGDRKEVLKFISKHKNTSHPTIIWVMCDVIKSMTKKFLPEFKSLLPVYQNWLSKADNRLKKSIEGAIKVFKEG